MTTPSHRNNVDKANGQTKLQVNERIMCRSLFDVFINSQQGNYIDKKQARQRDRAPSRIPTTQLKRVLRKSKKVISALRMHFHKSVPQSSKLHAYFDRRSSAYWRLTNQWSWCSVTNHKHRSQKHYLYEQQWIYIVIVRARSPKHKKVPLCCFYTNESLLGATL